MGDLFKTLGRFLTRDVFYILSGLYILIALNRVAGLPDIASLISSQSDVAKLILTLGTAYIVGFTVKEIFAFLHITIEAHYFEPGWLERFLYKLHQRDEWEQPDRLDHVRGYAKIAEAGADVQSRYDRISDVIHTFSSAGTSLTLSGAMLLFQDLRAGLIAVLGIVLLAMSRFQALRRMRFLWKYSS